MLATGTQPLAAVPVPGMYSASDLCRAMCLPHPRLAYGFATGLDRVLRHDAAAGLLEVQAGVPWSALQDFAFAGHVTGTVGESISANAPGPDGRPLGTHVRAFTLATADGQLRRASRERSAELFRLAIGGFGAVGPFYSVTLDLASLGQAVASAASPVRLDFGVGASVGSTHKVELLVPPECRDDVIREVRAAIAERHCVPVCIEAGRTLPERETLLRWARREYAALRIEFGTRATLGAWVAAAQVKARLLDVALAAGGSFMPAALPEATRAQAVTGYPMLAEFIAEKRRLDPAERISNPWYRGAVRVWRSEVCRARFGSC